MDNIQNLGKAASMFVEYDTMRSDGLLLRVTGAASPDQPRPYVGVHGNVGA